MDSETLCVISRSFKMSKKESLRSVYANKTLGGKCERCKSFNAAGEVTSGFYKPKIQLSVLFTHGFTFTTGLTLKIIDSFSFR